jgi:hypothetical protein
MPSTVSRNTQLLEALVSDATKNKFRRTEHNMFNYSNYVMYTTLIRTASSKNTEKKATDNDAAEQQQSQSERRKENDRTELCRSTLVNSMMRSLAQIR